MLFLVGVAGVTATSLVIRVWGERISVGSLLRGSSLLLYSLAVEFIGNSVHALQVLGLVPVSPAPVPSWPAVGMYPTWETAGAEIFVLMLIAVVHLWPQRLGAALSTMQVVVATANGSPSGTPGVTRGDGSLWYALRWPDCTVATGPFFSWKRSRTWREVGPQLR